MDDLQTLQQLYQNQPWFADVGTDQYGRFIVYMTEINHGSLNDVADYHNGKQVVVHFIAHKLATREAYVAEKPTAHIETTTEATELARSLLAKSKTYPIDNPHLGSTMQSLFEETGEWEEVQAGVLKKTLGGLESQCGKRVLEDILYEVHDKDNAVSDLSSTYPAVRAIMNGLFDEFGFDVLHEEICGE